MSWITRFISHTNFLSSLIWLFSLFIEMFIPDTVSCGNDLSVLVSQYTNGKIIISVLNLFPSKLIESPFVLPCYSGTACVKLSHYFMYQYQCSLLLLVFSISFHKIAFSASRVKTRHSEFQFLKVILLIRTNVSPHMSICFENNRVCVPQANWDAWFFCSFGKKKNNTQTKKPPTTSKLHASKHYFSCT